MDITPLPLSALQHLLFCERQCALIHLDQEWKENRFTAEGRVLHEKAHEGPDESRAGVRIVRGLRVSSEKWGLYGVCDVVEFHSDSRVVVVEYKRGKAKSHKTDEVQLCAQAICLEETLKIEIPEGFLFYGKPRRRTEVVFDESLRKLTLDTVDKLKRLLLQSTLPAPVYEKRKCDACSLQEICQPESQKSAKGWFETKLRDSLSIS